MHLILMNSLLFSKLAFSGRNQILGLFSWLFLLTRWSWWKWKASPWHSWKTRRGRGRPDEQQCVVQCFWILKPREEKVLLCIFYVPQNTFSIFLRNDIGIGQYICWQKIHLLTQWSLHSFHMTEWMCLSAKYYQLKADCHQMLSSSGRDWNGC